VCCKSDFHYKKISYCWEKAGRTTLSEIALLHADDGPSSAGLFQTIDGYSRRGNLYGLGLRFFTVWFELIRHMTPT